MLYKYYGYADLVLYNITRGQIFWFLFVTTNILILGDLSRFR